MCNARTIASKNTFSIKSTTFVLVPSESTEGPLEVRDVRTFRGPSWDVPSTLRAGWVISNENMGITTL